MASQVLDRPILFYDDRRSELSARVPDVPPTVVRPAWVRLPTGG